MARHAAASAEQPDGYWMPDAAGVMAFGAGAAGIFAHLQEHAPWLASGIAALYGAGGACLLGTVLLMVVALPQLVRVYPAVTLALLAGIAGGLVTALLAIMFFHQAP
jgi:hypothetical protein